MTLRAIALAAAAFVLCVDAACADGPFTTSTPVPDALRPGFDHITEAESEATLRHLVEGDMAGRGTGQPGFINAARWFAAELEAAGFQPAGTDGSFVQNVPFHKLATAPDRCSFSVGDAVLVEGKDIGISTYAGTLDSSLPVTFVTARTERPEIETGALAGRLLIIQAQRRISPDDDFILKAAPACVLIVSDDNRVRNEAVNQSNEAPSQIPSAMVTRTAANALAARCGLKPDFFAEGSPARGSVNIEENRVISMSTVVNCRLTLEREAVDVPNVIGWLPGSDPALQHEHICLGAHLDHLGEQRGELFPGADDNGSGSTALLQVARALGANPQKPKRSVLIIAFCAEERGLLGSKYYVENPTRPLHDMICMLNIDMVGRNEETPDEPASQNHDTIHLVGSRDRSAQMHEMVVKANEHVGFVFEYDEEDRVDGRSDHASFSAKDIPVAFLFGGFHPHYHRPSDNMEGINFVKLANAARLFYMVAHQAGDHGPFAPDTKAE